MMDSGSFSFPEMLSRGAITSREQQINISENKVSDHSKAIIFFWSNHPVAEMLELRHIVRTNKKQDSGVFARNIYMHI